MKKIISLLIIAVMTVLSLTSCGNKVRTKITEEEWDALNDITNYTCNVKGTYYEFALGTRHRYGYTDTTKVTENAKQYSSQYKNDPETTVYYCFSESGEAYRVSMSNDGAWEAKASKWTPRSLLGYITNNEVEFDDLTYNWKTKAYTCTVKDDDCVATYTYYFEEGKLAKAEMRYFEENDDGYVEDVTFSNLGTTTIALPEYTVKD